MTTAGQDRLFVPLSAEAFRWWQRGLKRWEIRRDVKRWGPDHVRIGRRVELRRGYSGPSLWGTIRKVYWGTLLLTDIQYYDVNPRAESWSEAMRAAGIIASDRGALNVSVCAFKVELDEGQVTP
jgi:hypothetical protein